MKWLCENLKRKWPFLSRLAKPATYFYTCFLKFSLKKYLTSNLHNLSQLMRLWYLSHRQPAKAQVSLHICTVSPEPSQFAQMKYGSRRRVRPKLEPVALLDAAYAHLKNEFTEDKKCHNLMTWLIFLFLNWYKWAASWQNQQNGMCTQRRLRSAWASAQPEQGLCCSHEESLGLRLPIQCTAKTLIRLGRMPRLIWVFTGCRVILLVLSWKKVSFQISQNGE